MWYTIYNLKKNVLKHPGRNRVKKFPNVRHVQDARRAERGEYRLAGAGLQGERWQGQGGVHARRIQKNCAIKECKFFSLTFNSHSVSHSVCVTLVFLSLKVIINFTENFLNKNVCKTGLYFSCFALLRSIWSDSSFLFYFWWQHPECLSRNYLEKQKKVPPLVAFH